MSADLEQLRTLLTVARASSFAAAATAMRVTPSAISQQMKALETRLGALLFEKSGRGLRLTNDATQLVDTIRPLFTQIDDALEEFSGGKKNARGTVAIAGPDAFCRMWLTPRIPPLLAAHEDLVLDVRYAQNDEVERAIVSGEVDLAILVATPESPEIETKIIYREALVAVASPAYLKKHGEPTQPSELDAHRFVVFDRNARILQAWLRDTFGARTKLQGHVVCSVRSLEQNLALAERGLGIAIVPNHVAQPSIDSGKVRAIEVERRTKGTTNPILLAWRRSAREAARVRAARDALLEK